MLAEIFFILIFTLILVTLLVPVGGYGAYPKRRITRESTPEQPETEKEAIGVGMAMVFFFFILFPLLLAGSAWVTPYGPVMMGVSWVPIVFIGISLALLLAAVTPRRRRRRRKGEQMEDPDHVAAASVFSFFFFVLIILGFGAFFVALA